MRKLFFASFLTIFILALHLNKVDAQTVCNVGSATGNDTQKIQNAIDSCAGGGEAKLSSGETYTAGTIVLKSGVTLNLNSSTIQASDNENDFISCKEGSTRNFFICTRAKTDSVVITGPGALTKTPGSKVDHSMVEFWNSSNLTVKNLTIDTTMADKTASGFHLNTAASNNILFENITVRGGRVGGQVWGNDGIHLQGSQNVTVRNCDISTHDDGIPIPASSGEGARNVLVEDCVVSSDSSALKFGTGSSDKWDGITFRNITIKNTNVAIGFAVYDGGEVSNVIYDNITVESDVKVLFACGGGAAGLGGMKDCAGPVDRDGDGVKETPGGYIHDVTFQNFEIFGGGSSTSHGEASLNTMDRVTLKNINFHEGSGTAPLAWFRDICGLSISGFTSHLTGDPTKDMQIDSSVTNLRLDGGTPNCGGAGSTPTPTSKPPLTGDLDGDNDVDIFDYNILVTNFGQAGENLADIDGNGDVDVFDYNILLENFGKIP